MSLTSARDVCRVVVQTDAGALDLVLPANIVVAAAIPSIVDIAAPGAPSSWNNGLGDWQLSRIGSGVLSPRKTLRENDVRDGDLLVLDRMRARAAPPPADDAIAAITTTLATTPLWTPVTTRAAGSAIGLCCSALATFGLLTGSSRPSGLIAAGLCAAAFVVSVACGRLYRESLAAVTFGVAATMWGAAAGYLLVPGGARAPKLMLAAAIGATVAVVCARCTGRGTAVFAGIATAGLLSTAVACACVLAPMAVSAAGAALAAVAVATLALAARLAILAGSLPVPRLALTDAPDDTPPGATVPAVDQTRALLTGLICGCSAAAVTGAALATLGGGPKSVAFAAVVSVVLVMRAGTHVDLISTCALLLGGTLCFAVVFLCLANRFPQYACWIAVGAAGVGAAATAACGAPRSPSPVVRRCLDLAEYGALAAVVPLACWACGVFGTVRGLR